MNTKGMNATGLILSMIIGIALIAVVFAIFFGKGSLYAGIFKIIPDPLEHIPIGTTSGDFGDSIGRRDAVSVFDEFAKAYMDLANVKQHDCFLFLPQAQFKYLFDEHYITILNDGNDLRIYLDNQVGTTKRENEATVSSISTSIPIKNASPCYIADAPAQLFYDFWLSDVKRTGPMGGVPTVNRIELTPKYKVFVDGQEKLRVKTDGQTLVLYKNGNNICLFATSNGGLRCSMNTKSGIKNIDDDCFNERKENSLQKLAVARGYPVYSNGQCSPWT